MKSRLYLFSLTIIACIGCKKSSDAPPVTPPPPPPVETTIRLKDMVVQGLPSPYYHFEYTDSGLVSKSSHASGVLMYDIHYASKQVREVESVHPVNKDRLVYEYENGKVSVIRYNNKNGTTFRRAFLTYSNQGQLLKIEWELRQGKAGFILERVLSLVYYADGNLAELHDHRKAIDGQQQEAVYIDRFFDYDDKENVDDFSLIHKNGEHLALFPRQGIQKNNPRKNIRSGDGLHYEINYVYSYKDNVPVKKIGNAVFTNGPDIGKLFTTTTSFSYFQ